MTDTARLRELAGRLRARADAYTMILDRNRGGGKVSASLLEEARNYVREAAAAIDELDASKARIGEGWQDIATAPKDTSRDNSVDIWMEPIPERQALFSNPATEGRRLCNAWFVERTDYTGWRNVNSFNGREVNWRATHWRPLPPPPVRTHGDAKMTTILDEEAIELAAEALWDNLAMAVPWKAANEIASTEPESTYVGIVASFRKAAERSVRAYLSALATPSTGAVGWVTVPVEPTLPMIHAGRDAIDGRRAAADQGVSVYRAMIAASPPSSPERDAALEPSKEK